MSKVSAGELISAIRAEIWDAASAAQTCITLMQNAQKYLQADGKATYNSGIWFQSVDYLHSHMRDKMPPAKLFSWEQQLINSRNSYK